MTEKDMILETIKFVKETLQHAEGGHDWFHTERVWKMAKRIVKEEGGNALIVELAALLHDISDAKFNGGDEELGSQIASEFLAKLKLDKNFISAVSDVINNVSFKGGNETVNKHTIELQIVQDADRLDALGAIGIARTFNYGGFKNRAMYDPKIKPNLNHDKESYRKSTAPSINHFYEKLLLLKDRMHTSTAKKIAQERHKFMEGFLEQFYNEWDAK